MNAEGELQGERFQVNTTDEDQLLSPQVAMNADGDFVIAWDRDFGRYAVYAQRYNEAGEAQGDEILVAPATEPNVVEEVGNVRVAIDQDGEFIVAWNQFLLDDEEGFIGSGVFARRYTADGEPTEDAVRVDATDAEPSLNIVQDVALDADGDYVVTWVRGPLDFSGGQLFVQRFTADGERDDGETPVNDSTDVSFFGGGVAMSPAGDFVAVWVDQEEGNDGDDVFAQRFTVSAPVPTIATDTIGVYSTTGSAFFLRNSNSAGPGDLSFTFGAADQGYVPIAGDWNGDGVDTIGVYSQATGAVFLRNNSSSGPADIAFQFGAGGQGYIPLAGDWDGDGTDAIGLYSPTTGGFLLKNSNSSGAADIVVFFGPGGQGLVPLAGDWNGDGTDTVGLYRSQGGVFLFRDVNEPGVADVIVQYGAGGNGLLPVVGSWDGDEDDTVGLYRTATGTFLLRNENTAGPADVTPFGYGAGGDSLLPLIGNWEGPEPLLNTVALAGVNPDELISRLTQLGINLQHFLGRRGIDLHYVDLPGDQIIDVSGHTVFLDLEEVGGLLDGIDEGVLSQLKEIDLTPVLDQLNLLFLTLEEVEFRVAEIDSIIDDLLDSNPDTPSPEQLRQLAGR